MGCLHYVLTATFLARRWWRDTQGIALRSLRLLQTLPLRPPYIKEHNSFFIRHLSNLLIYTRDIVRPLRYCISFLALLSPRVTRGKPILSLSRMCGTWLLLPGK